MCYYRELLQTGTAADFYAVMAQFGEKLRRAQLLPSSEFIQVSPWMCINCVRPFGSSKIPSTRLSINGYDVHVQSDEVRQAR